MIDTTKALHDVSGYIHAVSALLKILDNTEGTIDNDVKEIISLLNTKSGDIEESINTLKRNTDEYR